MKLAILISLFILTYYITFCQTSGPAQPEYKSYIPVDTKELVNDFTGSFHFNIPVITIPGPRGSDYSLILTYQSGTSPSELSSWVGFGWSLNPGAIVRQKRGFPDDFKKVKVKFWNQTLPNITATASVTLRNEILSNDMMKKIGANITLTKLFNNFKGYKERVGFGVDFFDIVSLNCMWENDGSAELTGNVSAAGILSRLLKISNDKDNTLTAKNLLISFVQREYQAAFSAASTQFLSNYITPGFGFNSLPTNVPKYSGEQFSFKPAGNYEVDYIKREIESLPAIWNKRIQKTESPELFVFGYCYSGNLTSGDSDDLMDYAVEKESYFDKRDKYLGIPFSEADIFSLAGQGLQGGFRAHHKHIGHFRPNQVTSTTELTNWGVMAGYGDNPNSSINFGFDYSGGSNRLTIGGWNNSGTSFQSNQNIMDAVEFRFTNDPGTSYVHHHDHVSADELFKPTSANISSISGLPVLSYSANKLRSDGDMERIKNKSSQISYFTFKDVIQEHSKSPMIINKNDGKEIEWSNFTNVDENLIAGFSIINKEGFRYNYGLPVFNRNERQISYGINRSNSISDNFSIQNNYLAFMQATPQPDFPSSKDINNNNSIPKVCVGTEMNEPYPGSYLITEILSPDYVDLTGDGPTNDDLGYYTKFNYIRAAGTDSKREYIAPNNYDGYWMHRDGYPSNVKDSNKRWYKWRTPYNGLYYNRNSISSVEDDMGSFSMGEMEIYYLKSIETKTHIAYFVTNKTNIQVSLNGQQHTIAGHNQERQDGYEASHYEVEATGSPDADWIEDGLDNTNKLEFLERIELYAKDPNNPDNLVNLLQTTFFQYDQDYPIWNGQPNSNGNKGKLTLKRVWFEGENVKNYGISPYVFEYTYGSPVYPSEYTNLSNYAGSKNETPNFDIRNTDRWGNYRNDGENRINNMEEWVNQANDATFDPAAWNLKRIKLPSTGEIHVQYEQNQYSFVEDKNSTVMAKVTNVSLNSRIVDINYADAMGLTDLTQISNVGAELVGILNQNYKYNNDNRLYFKFLYTLKDNLSGLDFLTNDFVNGYFALDDVGATLQGSGIIRLTIKDDNGFMPNKKCIQFYRDNRLGLLSNPKYSHSEIFTKDYLDEDGTVNLLYNSNGVDLVSCNCEKMDINHSYVKIPIPPSWSKKGGGIRVKRLLTLDNFDVKAGETGTEPRLYGVEYLYLDKNGNCSGVANNEPSLGKEDNALTTNLIKRDPNSFDWSLNALSYGPEDLEQYEGPLGEFIRPSPLVGYSRILKKNIYNQASNGGILEKTFYTAKDYPIRVFHTELSETDKSKFVSGSAVPPPFMRKSESYYKTQGYSFILNSMHGQPKTISTYLGLIDEHTTDFSGNDWINSRSTSYNYFDIGKSLPVMQEGYKIHQYFQGYEEEIVTESRNISDVTSTINGEIDATIFVPLIPPYVLPSFFLGYNYLKFGLKTHVTSTVLRSPAILKSIYTKADGVEKVTENIAFDKFTGIPLITKTYDGFEGYNLQQSSNHDGSYININIPAAYEYSNMGQASKNEGTSVHSGFHYNVWRRIGNDPLIPGNNCYHLIFEFDKLDCDKPVPDDEEDYNFPYYWQSWPARNIINPFMIGDIIKVIPRIDDNGQGGVSDATGEYYRVKQKVGNILLLDPMLHGLYSGQTLTKDKVNVFIIRSGNTNLLNDNVMNVLSYSNDLPDINQLITEYNQNDEELQMRQRFIDGLNNAIRNISLSGPLNVPQPIAGTYLDMSTILSGRTLKLYGPYGDVITISDNNGLNSILTIQQIDEYIPKITSPPAGDEFNDYKSDIRVRVCMKMLPAFSTFSTDDCCMDLHFILDNITDMSYVNPFILTSDGKIKIGSNPIVSQNPPHKYKDTVWIGPNTWDNNYSCIKFYEEYRPEYKVNNVIDASASPFKDDWTFVSNDFNIVTTNNNDLYNLGQKGKWRKHSDFKYLDNIIYGSTAGTDQGERVYNKAGVFNSSISATSPFYIFNPKNGFNSNNRWFKINETTSYFPTGYPVEFWSMPNVESTVKVGNSGAPIGSNLRNTEFPSVQATNSGYFNIGFQSWEMNGFDNTIAHTGKRSLYLSNNSLYSVIDGLKLSPNMISTAPTDDKGILCRVWARTRRHSTESEIYNFLDCQLQVNLEVTNSNGTYVTNMNLTFVSQTGAWALYQGVLKESFSSINFNNPHNLKVNIKSDRASASKPVWIDDFVIQPLYSEATCYTYDLEKIRLDATLDNNHFATYFQYDGEGKLHRMLKETINGVYTVSERNYHTPATAERDGSLGFIPLSQPATGIRMNGEEMKQFENMKLYDYDNIDGKPNDIKGDFEIFEFRYNSEEQKMEFFGVQKDKILKRDSLKIDKMNLMDSLKNRMPIKGFDELKNSVDSLELKQDFQLNQNENNNEYIKDIRNPDFEGIKKRVINGGSIGNINKYEQLISDSIRTKPEKIMEMERIKNMQTEMKNSKSKSSVNKKK